MLDLVRVVQVTRHASVYAITQGQLPIARCYSVMSTVPRGIYVISHQLHLFLKVDWIIAFSCLAS